MSTTQNYFFDVKLWKDAVDVARDVTRVRKIGFLVYPDMEILDLSGPLDAFFYADRHLRAMGRTDMGRTDEPGYETLVIAAQPGLVRTKCGLQVMATHGYADVTESLDTLIVAGSEVAEQACANVALVEWVKTMAPRSRRVAAVCTGAFILAAAGLLNNRKVTTHWGFSDRLAELFPSLRVEPNRIFVRDGNYYTSGGVTSGIDLALNLIEEDLGREIPRIVAGAMVVFLRRPGGQTQFSPFLQAEARSRRDIRELQAWIVSNPAQELEVARLADRVAMSPRNFARLFQSETGMTPAKFVEHARTESARCKLEQTSLSVEAIAGMCGFGSANRMRRSFQRLLDVAPHEYRERFQSTATK